MGNVDFNKRTKYLIRYMFGLELAPYVLLCFIMFSTTFGAVCMNNIEFHWILKWSICRIAYLTG